MRLFDYNESPLALLTPDVVSMVADIHEHKGRQGLFIEAHADALKHQTHLRRYGGTTIR
ncbi:MAG: hypothetical protein LBS11_07085 [Oscillospiraceae bacterium]|jgi:hypothetical protein|nr:hypothetical protein [Oscillospiraceae bacterium]